MNDISIRFIDVAKLPLNCASVKVILKNGAKLPVYQTSGAAGADLCSLEELYIRHGEYHLISTGVHLELPEGIECQVRPRSGLAVKYGVTVLNSPGTIDSDYRGEVKVALINHGQLPFHVNVGDRIAQLVFANVTRAFFEQVDELSDTERGSGGFGSTGLNLRYKPRARPLTRQD